ncbi:MAG: alpha/beta hydrolase [Sedimentisphaerales bacterium]|nr:alpha/beta hydrolase [Sedimentisphaerales bacterium]
MHNKRTFVKRRNMNRYFRIVLLCFIAAMSLAAMAAVENAASPQKEELLWPDGTPGAKGDQEGDKPTLTIYLPPKEKVTGAAVVICPGGGYGSLAMDHEGRQIAQWLNSLGVTGFILKYRHRNSGAGYGHPAPLQDAQRAIRMVRSHAQEWGIDSNRVGIIGFSAGGHLASTTGTHFDNGNADANDTVEKVSCRPDFMILIYPVISFTEWYVHAGSRQNLLGGKPDKNILESLSNEKQVTPETPPTFLVHANDDVTVPPENSIYFYLALRKAKVPAEMHIYQRGDHGFGLGKKDSAASGWPDCCASWMKERGLLDNKK